LTRKTKRSTRILLKNKIEIFSKRGEEKMKGDFTAKLKAQLSCLSGVEKKIALFLKIFSICY